MPILRNSKTREINDDFFGIYKKYWAEEVPEGRQQGATSLLGGATPWPRLGGLWAPCWPTGPPLLLYGGFRSRKKSRGGFREESPLP